MRRTSILLSARLSIFCVVHHNLAGKKRIIPVITKDFDWSQIPLMLRRYQFLNEPSPSIAGKRVAEVVSKHESAETAQNISSGANQ